MKAKVVFAVWVAAVLVSGHRYILGFARIPESLDFKYDYVANFQLSRGESLSGLHLEAADSIGRSLGAPPGPYWDGPAVVHPPPGLALARPLLALPYRVAVWVWAALSAIALAFLARILLGIWRGSASLPSWKDAAPAALALLVWPPAVFNFAYGQTSAFLALTVAAGWWSLEHGRERGAAAWLAAAVAIRATPGVLFGYLLPRARRAAAWTAGLFLVFVLVSAPLTGGLSGWRVFFANSAPTVAMWETWQDNTVSVRGIIVRALIDNPYARAPLNHPALAHALAVASSALLVAVAFLAGRPTRRDHAPAGDHRALTPAFAPAFAIWACLVPLLNPLSWTHNALVFLVPAVLLARKGNPRGCRVATAVAFVLLTIPRDTLFALAGGEWPYPASRGWILGLHALGGLILFGAACVTAIRSRPPPSRRGGARAAGDLLARRDR